jgi:hypothetical protein
MDTWLDNKRDEYLDGHLTKRQFIDSQLNGGYGWRQEDIDCLYDMYLVDRMNEFTDIELAEFKQMELEAAGVL